MSKQGVFDLLGLSELRDHGVALPRRRVVAFGNATVTDDAPRRTTRVVRIAPPAAIAPETTETSIGNDEDWSTTYEDGGASWRIYDSRDFAGDWFGKGTAGSIAWFSEGLSIGLTTAPLTDPPEYVVIEGLSPVAAVTRKAIVNHGPGVLWFRSPADPSIYPGAVRAAAPMCMLEPGAAAWLVLDPVDLRWLVRAKRFAGFG